MKRFIILNLVFVLFNSSIFADEISIENQVVLEKFFRTLFKQSEGGYVFYGKKPVCINGFYIKDHFFPGFLHESSVYLKEGMRVWKKLNLQNNQEYILHAYDVNDSYAKNCKHILFIHRDSFLQTVQENIALFQYVLGSEVTPELLLTQLTDPYKPFHTTLKNDKVLIGIILGFGVQNSLFVSRIENLQEALFESETPPLKSLLMRSGSVQKEFKEMLLLSSGREIQSGIFLEPSFGFGSIQNEMKQLVSKMEVSSEKLIQQSPAFIFGRLKIDTKSDHLIKDLEFTQAKIQQILRSEEFLSNILNNKFYANVQIHSRNQLPSQYLLPFTLKEINNLSKIVAVNLSSFIEEEDDSFIDAFFLGMQEADKGFPKRPYTTDMNNYLKYKSLLEAKKNCNFVMTFFLI